MHAVENLRQLAVQNGLLSTQEGVHCRILIERHTVYDRSLFSPEAFFHYCLFLREVALTHPGSQLHIHAEHIKEYRTLGFSRMKSVRPLATQLHLQYNEAMHILGGTVHEDTDVLCDLRDADITIPPGQELYKPKKSLALLITSLLWSISNMRVSTPEDSDFAEAE